MTTHVLYRDAIWDALDRARKRLSVSWSELERRCGLSASYFSKTRQHSSWPSMETIAAVLAATDTSQEQFADEVDIYIGLNGGGDGY